MDNSDSRAAILAATIKTLTNKGFGGTTIEAIANEAGMSKGGVLYYFTSKQELISAAMMRHEELLFMRRDQILASLPDTPSKRVRAMVLAMVEYLEFFIEGKHSGVGVLGDAHYLELLGGIKRRIYAAMAEGTTRPEQVAMITLVLDGLWTHKMFSPPTIARELEEKTIELLLSWIDHCFDDPPGNAVQ